MIYEFTPYSSLGAAFYQAKFAREAALDAKPEERAQAEEAARRAQSHYDHLALEAINRNR